MKKKSTSFKLSVKFEYIKIDLKEKKKVKPTYEIFSSNTLITIINITASWFGMNCFNKLSICYPIITIISALLIIMLISRKD